MIVDTLLKAGLRTFQKTSGVATNIGDVLIDWMRPLGKITESSHEITDVGDFASAVTDSRRLRQVIDGQIDSSFDEAVQTWANQMPANEIDMTSLQDTTNYAKAEYKRQLNRLVGGEQGLRHLTHNLPGRMRQQLEASVGEVTEVLKSDVSRFLNDFNPADAASTGAKGTSKGHMSLPRRPESAIKEHMEGLNQGLKEITKDYIKTSKWDSWEDFQRLNWNDHIMDRHHKLLKQIDEIPDNNQPFEPELGGNSITNRQARADLRSKLDTFYKDNVTVFKKGDLIRGDYINMLYHQGKGRYHYIGKNGDKFEVRLERDSGFDSEVGSYRQASEGYGIEGYAYKGKWHQGLPPEEGLIDYWSKGDKAGSPMQINPERVRHIVSDSFSVGQIPKKELDKLKQAGVDTRSKLMTWTVSRIENKRPDRFTKEVIDKIPDAEKPIITQLGARKTYEFRPIDPEFGAMPGTASKEIVESQNKMVKKFLTAEGTNEKNNMIDAMRVMDFGAEYSSSSMSPQSLGLALGHSRRAAQRTKRALDTGEDMGFVSQGQLYNFEQHMNDIGRKTKNPLDEFSDSSFKYKSDEFSANLSGSMELSPFRKVKGSDMMVRSDFAKNIDVEHFFEGMNFQEHPERTVRGVIKNALKMGDSLSFGQIQKSAIANNPNLRHKLTFVDSITHALNRVENHTPQDVLKKILPEGHTPERFVDDLTDAVAEVDKQFKRSHGQDASVFLDFDGIEFDAAGNIIGEPQIQLFHTGFTGGVSTTTKQTLKQNWAMAAPLGPGFKFVYGGEKKEK